jgi:hypothetical protein
MVKFCERKHTVVLPMRIYIVGQYDLLARQKPTERWGCTVPAPTIESQQASEGSG